jgi:glycosyltransferase involved in cell wall biosynthesis
MAGRRYEPGAIDRDPDPVVSRVLFVETNTDGTVGGSHRCMYELMTRLDPGEFEPVALFYQDNIYRERIAARGFETHVWPDVARGGQSPGSLATRIWTDARAIARRVTFLRDASIDLVHLNNTPGSGYEDWLPASLLTRVPCISHARSEPNMPSTRKGRIAARRFRRVIAVSDHVAQSLVAEGLPARLVRRIYDGIDCEGFVRSVRRSAGEVRAELGIPRDAWLIAMVGHVRAWKGQHVVVRALEGLPRPLLARTRCLFVGDVPAEEAAYARSVEESAQRAGLRRIVTLTGRREDVAEIMAAADVVVHASTLPEPFGLVVIEAMALGKPVIASKLGGPAEIVTQSTGLLFDPGVPEELTRALVRLADDPGLAAALGAAAPERARQFDVAKTVAETSGVYRSLLRHAR